MHRMKSYLPLSLLALAASTLLLVAAPHAQQTAKVIATCGTASYTAGTTNYETIDTTGASCGAAGSVSGTVTANQGTKAAQTLANAWPVMIPSASTAATAALASNLVVSNAAAALISFNVSADTTLSGAAWWVMIFNSTTLPGDGAVTPAKCYALPSGATSFNGSFGIPPAFSTGIVIGVSTTGCFTKTASVHAFISGDYR